MPICNHCGYEGTGNYCAECGKPYEVKRLTVASLLHEVAHLFTHLDKGFGYTLKQLATRPGRMQKDYILGKRSVHQKPFSMFFRSFGVFFSSISGNCLSGVWQSQPRCVGNYNSFPIRSPV